MGRKRADKAKGGIARAEVLSPEERSRIAQKAAAARWGVRATHKGNFREEFGIDVDCYVLSDEQKTAVVSQRGMSAALNMSGTSSRALLALLEGRKIAPYVGPELREKLLKPLIFQWAPVVSKGAAKSESGLQLLIHGYDVTILIDVCKAIVRAEENVRLLERQKKIARQAHVILNASAKAGIKGLVYALAGYDATREEVVAAFKYFVREEAREYEKEFPDQLYGEWYRLYQLPKPEKNKPWKFKHLTVNQVYTPLARSNGKILALTRAQKAVSADRRAKLHQFLSEIGVKALRTHLGQLLGIAQVSENQAQYERHVEKVFGAQISLPFSE
jgi:P63C domain